MIEALPQRRLTSAEVLAMVEAGILDPHEPVELIDGRLIAVSPQGPVHSGLTAIIREALREAYRDCGHVQDHSPIDAGPDSMPEPDVAVVRGPARAYLERHPGGADLVLVVEIAHTTHAAARAKAAVYARADVPTYWLVDVPARRVEVYSGGATQTGEYRLKQIAEDSDELALPETRATVPVAALLP